MSSGSKFEDESFDLSEIQGGEEHPIFLHDGTKGYWRLKAKFQKIRFHKPNCPLRC